MRYYDAPHVDLGSFYARRPRQGRVYRLFGYAACVGVVAYAAEPARISILLVLLAVAWVMAWRREVGALWRSSLVAAIAMSAVILTCDRLGHPLAHAARPAERVIEIHSPSSIPEIRP
jgi:hypothetical protein